MGEMTATVYHYPTGSAARISPISAQLITLGGDNTAIVWDAAWQKPKIVLTGHLEGINSVDWSKDETKLVTASLDSTVRVWDAQTGQSEYIVEGHQGSVNQALWSPDGAHLATAGDDGWVHIWNSADGTLVRSIETNGGAVSSLVWSPNSQRIISGHRDGSLRIWEVDNGKLLETLHGHQSLITDLKWSPANDQLASSDGSGNARIWNTAFSTAWRLYPPQAAQGGNWTEIGDWSSDGRYMVMAGGDNVNLSQPPSLGIWDVETNNLIKEELGKTLNLLAWMPPEFSPDDKAFLYQGIRGWPDLYDAASAYIFDINSGQIIGEFTTGGEHAAQSTGQVMDRMLLQD